MTFSHSLYAAQGEINIDRRMEWQVQRVVCSSLVVHKYIDRRTISPDETYSEFKMSLTQSTSEILIN